MDHALAFAITALAVARITKLITSDFLTAGPRAKLIQRWGPQSKLSYLITCPWCASMWVAAPAAPIAYWWGTSAWVWIPAAGLAYSYIAGFLANAEGDN